MLISNERSLMGEKYGPCFVYASSSGELPK